MIFEFTIWDTHKQPVQTEDGDLVWHNVDDADDEAPWKTFKFALEFKQVKVDYFYETVIFQQDVPIRCTRIVLSDGSSVLAKWQYDTFRDRYNELKE